MRRRRPLPFALLLAPIALSLLLSADAASAAAGADTLRATTPQAAAGPRVAPAAPRTEGPAITARRPARRVFASSVTDSARRAYRAWLRHLRARAVADSVARADSLARAATRAGAAPAGLPPATGGRAAYVFPGAAGRDYLAQIRADFTPLNRDYANTRAALGFIDPLYALLVALFLLFSGLSARMRDLAHRVGSRAYARTLVYLALFLVADFVLSFPLSYYEGFGLEHQYALSTESFGGWFVQQLTGLAVGVFFFGVVPIVHLAYGAVRRFPRRWWLALGLGTLPVILIGVLIAPVLVDPLYNRFTPLQDKKLEAQILEVTRRAGVPARHVFQVDKSRQTVKYNAYVTGFGPSHRVVIWDTTLKGMKPDEILFVVGHEAGHYRLHHIWIGIGSFTLLGFLAFRLCAAVVRGATRVWGRRWGFVEAHDLASLPLFAAALTLVAFLGSPVVNAFSRGVEHQADAFGLEVTHLNDAAARAFIALGAQSRSDPEPSPLVELFEYDHPPLLDRVRFALTYQPWAEGKPDRYYHPAR